ncbi:hypothetical protein HanRHA438_Chr12g0548931 [Helianthus annuus]|uniref:Uncharacterized protein n=1 Tax=Helianthus annuus TaxID=4232 RepID=A0A9K3JGK3_HELAN|nr:hypothetical protein HanXRQr2_Chr03g0112521 [Helianthus annuus]KAJ0866196.1 hypothetical protein HanRHA438_Chr12g0548931 [Helianthus annuus]
MMWQNQHFDSGLGDFVSCHPVSQPVLASAWLLWYLNWVFSVCVFCSSPT